VNKSSEDAITVAIRPRIILSDVLSSVVKGPKFRPQTSKGVVEKCEGLEILAAEFFLDLQKKGPNFFKTHGSGVIWEYSEMNKFSTQLYAHILLQFFSFHNIICSGQQVSMGGRIFFLFDNLAGKF
jgi:hypothetical protein